MDPRSAHPDPKVLHAFSLGQLAPDKAAAVEEHISHCRPCCDTLLEAAQDDTFVALLRNARKPTSSFTAERLPEDQETPIGLLSGPVDPEHQPASQPDESPADTSGGQPVESLDELRQHPRYQVLRLVGKGGMGDVYLARHRVMERSVAIKIMNRQLMCKSAAVDRFRREVKAAARLSHPNIVTAYDAERAGDVHFLVMEYVDGMDLARRVKESGPLPVSQACDYVRQVALGLQYAHEQGMVHRDIKPHNLMVAADGTVKILDFGLASLAPGVANADLPAEDGQLTAAGSVMGTPDFISPEQVTDARRADIRSDIYSLGATLYYLLAGRPPFSEGNVMQKLQQHAERNPEPIEMVRVDVPPELADVIRRMMAKDPAQRWQTPAELADALAPFVDRERSMRADSPPKVEVPETRRRRIQRWAMPALVALGLVVAWIIYVFTDTGTLVIEAVDDTVELAVRPLIHDSREGKKHALAWKYRRGDTVTGSTTRRLRSGAYIVLLKDPEQYELSQDRFILKRGGRVVVRVTRKPSPSGIPVKPVPNTGAADAATPSTDLLLDKPLREIEFPQVVQWFDLASRRAVHDKLLREPNGARDP